MGRGRKRQPEQDPVTRIASDIKAGRYDAKLAVIVKAAKERFRNDSQIQCTYHREVQ
jgi:hypothetical protein